MTAAAGHRHFPSKFLKWPLKMWTIMEAVCTLGVVDDVVVVNPSLGHTVAPATPIVDCHTETILLLRWVLSA